MVRRSFTSDLALSSDVEARLSKVRTQHDFAFPKQIRDVEAWYGQTCPPCRVSGVSRASLEASALLFIHAARAGDRAVSHFESARPPAEPHHQ